MNEFLALIFEKYQGSLVFLMSSKPSAILTVLGLIVLLYNIGLLFTKNNPLIKKMFTLILTIIFILLARSIVIDNFNYTHNILYLFTSFLFLYIPAIFIYVLALIDKAVRPKNTEYMFTVSKRAFIITTTIIIVFLIIGLGTCGLMFLNLRE